MKPIHAALIVASLMFPPCAAQAGSEPTTPQAEASEWVPSHALGAPLRTLGAPARAIGKLFKRIPTTGPGGRTEGEGLTAFEQLQANSTPLGLVFSLDTNVGYGFTSHVSGDVGIPMYFDRSPFSLVTNHDWRWTTWVIGEPYVDIRYTANGSGRSFTSIITGTIPASSPQRIFGTGRFGGDWFNHIDQSYKGFTAFPNIGVATGTLNRYAMPRPYSIARPYQTLGFMSDFEGGASYTVRHGVAIGASAYALKPAGQQKVFSRLVAPDSSIASDGNHNRLFDAAFETVGPSRIARDNGYSGWVEATRLLGHATLQIGYTHSVRYAYDSLTLMLNFDGSYLFKPPKK